MIIRKNSWHYCFMDFMAYDPETRTDTCSYWSGFIWAVLFAILLTVLLFGLLFVLPIAAVADILYSTSVSSLTGLQVLVSWGVGMLLYAVVIAVIVGLAFVSEVRTNRDSSLFAAWWQSFKEKTCTKVDFE